MKISSKAKYALASMLYLAEHQESGMPVSVFSISEALGISKIYLEQVFALLKRADLVRSVKGPSGGYSLSRSASSISVYDVIVSIESGLFGQERWVLGNQAAHVEKAMREQLWDRADQAVTSVFSGISLEELLGESIRYRKQDHSMYYI